MNFKSYILPILCILFLLIGGMVEYQSFQSPNVKKYQQNIEIDLHQKEAVILDIENQKNQLERILRNQYSSKSLLSTDLAWLEKISKSPYTFQLYQQDSLVFWSNNHVDFHKKRGDLKNTPSQFLELSDGYYEVIQYPIDLDEIGNLDLVGFIPIKYKYNLESKYLQDRFTSDVYLPKELELNQDITASPFQISNSKGEVLCSLSHEGKISDQRTIYVMFFFYLFGFVFLGLIINRVAKKLVRDKSLLSGASFLIASLVVLRIFSMLTDFNHRFESIQLFEKTPEIFLFGNSLGDFIINIGLLLWVILFIHRHFQMPHYKHHHFLKRFALVFINAFGMVFFVANVAAMLKQLIFYSNIPFNFDNIFNLESNSLFAIGGVILLLISLFLIGHFIMIIILQTKIKVKSRFVAYVLAILTFIPLSWAYDLNLINPTMFLFLSLFIGLFDIFIEHETNNLTWLVTWLIILAGLSSTLLYGYNQERETINRLKYAQSILTQKDTIAEQKLIRLENLLLENDMIQDFQKFGNVNVNNEELYKTVDDYYSNSSYLYNNYEYSSSFGDEDKINFSDFDLVNENQNKNSAIYLSNEDQKNNTYFLKIPLWSEENSMSPQFWVLEFFHKRRKQSRVYSELLQEQEYKNLEGLKNYEYAIYKNKIRVNATSNRININDINSSKNEVFADTISVGMLTSTYSKDNKTVILQKNIGGYIKPISLFSFVFALLILFVFLMSIINTFSGIFPKTLSFSVIRRPSLRGKIQLYVISLIVVSFVLIGVVTVVYFSNSHEEYHENRLVRKTESVIKDTEREIELLITKLIDQKQKSSDDEEATISWDEIDIKELNLKAISKIHRMDVNLFDQTGALVQSSEMDIFQKGVIAPRMNALAFQKLVRLESSKHFQDIEQIGTLDYKSAYIPLKPRLNREERTIGYLGLPYYSKQSSLREDVTVFMGTLLNVYVFLLIIAGAIAIFVANSITKPMAVIGEKLKEFKLGGSNEPLEWHSHDELGALIEEYNRMVLKIKEGADNLAQSEREGAWREMAKQVAHEIKNPLTPMKLSIQYLEHAYRSDPGNIEHLLKRVSTTLIEQIDNLSQIASEFSNFAKMPRAENQRILLNNLVHNVYDLFKKDPKSEILIELPPDDYYVYADKNHLIRVFNNLIKNATQAIPDGRAGHILVKMFTEKGKILVEVRDNGTGISEAMKEKVFVPNFTTKNSGTGLGLAISKNIIESVSGEIYFTTKVGKGTSFFVKLPVIDVKKPDEILVI